jgi:nitrate reductase NapD
MDISSVILRARPEKLVSVRNGLAALPGVEIHADADDGRLVLTIEDRGEASAEVFMKLSELDGVLSASLVYQYCDDEPSGESTNGSQ